MRLKDIHVEVRDPNLKRVGAVNLKDAELILNPVFNNVGTWELKLPVEDPMVKLLRKPGYGIVATGPKPGGGKAVFLSGPMTHYSSKASSSEPDGMVTFTGITDDHHLRDRLAYPVPTSATMAGQKAKANDKRQGPVETLMHEYVNANMGPAAPLARRIPTLRMGTNLGRGHDVKKTARFKVVGNLLLELAPLGLLGFRIVQSGSTLEFQTFQQRDKRKLIRFDLWNNTLASYEVEEAAALVTHVIVAGQEEGVDRQLYERTSESSLEQEKLWHRRIETFLDQRQTSDVEELQQAGDELLATDGIAQKGVKFAPMDEVTMRYLFDWTLGDVVTAVVEGREIAAVVTEAIIKVDNNGVRVAAALGDQTSTGNAINSVEARLSALERNVEIPSDLADVLDQVRTGTLPKLRLSSTTDLSETSTGHALQIGPDSGLHLAMDNNEIGLRKSGAWADPVGFPSGIWGLPAPASASAATTKAYVDEQIAAKVGAAVGITDLGASVNLDSIITTGLYRQPLNNNITAGLNYPGTNAGLLEVFAQGNMVWQRYTEFGGAQRKAFWRGRYGTTWGGWQVVATAPDGFGTGEAVTKFSGGNKLGMFWVSPRIKLRVDNADFTLVKDGDDATLSTLRITSATDASGTSTAHGLQIGPDSGDNLRLDDNEVTALKGGANATLYLNPDGGDVAIGNNTDSKIILNSAGNITLRNGARLEGSSGGPNIGIRDGSDRGLLIGEDSDGARMWSSTALVYDRTYTASANMHITSAGTFGRGTSLRAAKVEIEDAPAAEWVDALDKLRPRTWLDKGTVEHYADLLDREEQGEVIDWSEVDVSRIDQRIPGFVAEEVVEEAGLQEFGTYDNDGALSGVAYDRITALLVAVAQDERRQRIALETQMTDVLARLAALENGAA